MMVGKKIYLLYPPVSKEERYSSKIGSAGGHQIPLGIFYLASYLREHGYFVKVTDAEAHKLISSDIIKEVEEFAPDFIGISSTTVVFNRALEVANLIKKKFSKIKIILGGTHVTSNVFHAMSFGVFDYGVLREGEVIFLELLDTLYNKRSVNNVNGVTFRKKGKIIVNPPREYINNLDILPFPAYDLIEDINIYNPPPSRYKTLPVINIITSRGCPYQCIFCDKNVFGDVYRERSAQNVFDELKYLWTSFHMKEIAFMDDTFLINKKRIYELFELLNKEGIKFYWSCMTRTDNVDYQLLKFLKENGCWNISFGIESGDKQILKIIKKNISLKQTKQVIEWCHKLGIKTSGFFILGNPGETVKTLNKTINFACELKLNNVSFTFNTPIPGSVQYLEVNKYGSLDITNWSKFNYVWPVFIPKGLTKDILFKKYREAYRRFYLRPRIIFSFFLRFFGRGGFRRFKSLTGPVIFLFNKEYINKNSKYV